MLATISLSAHLLPSLFASFRSRRLLLQNALAYSCLLRYPLRARCGTGESTQQRRSCSYYDAYAHVHGSHFDGRPEPAAIADGVVRMRELTAGQGPERTALIFASD